MVRGLYTSASGALVAQSQVDAIANNLANVNTGGFKQTLTQIQSAQTLDIFRIQNDPGKIATSQLPGVPTQAYVGTLGLGSQIYDTPTDFQSGALQTTGNALDLAVTGNDRAFFTIQTANGVRYTRNGEFVRDGAGTLRTQDGNAVLGANGAPIQLQNGDVTVANDGTISQNNQVVGRLQLTQFANTVNLRPEGANNFAPSGNAGASVATGVSVQQGFLEKSNSNVVRSMVDLITAERWFDANEKSIKAQDDATNSAITQVAKTQ